MTKRDTTGHSPLRGPLLVVKPSGEIVGANQAAEELLGRCVGKRCWDMVGATDLQRGTICSPGCTEALEATGDSDRQALARGEVVQLSCCRAGEYVVVEVRPAPEEASGATARLSKREREILQLVAEGLSSTAIAERLDLGVSTVRTYALKARKKLDATTLAEAVAKAMAARQLP